MPVDWHTNRGDKSMAKHLNGHGTKSIPSLCFLCILFILTSVNAHAVSVTTSGNEGISISVWDAVRNDPERFIEGIKRDLEFGELKHIGRLGSYLRQEFPDNREVRALYSIYLASNGYIEQAKKELEGYSGRTTKYDLFAKALISKNERDYDTALKICKQAVAMDKKHPYPWNIMGSIYFDLKQYRNAHVSFQKAVDLQPGFLLAYTNMGFVSLYMEDYDGATAYFQKVIKMNPDGAKARIGLALVHEIQGKYSQALEELRKATKANPNNHEIMKKIAELQLLTGRYAEALETGKKMEQLGLKESFIVIGEAALHGGNTDHAIAYLKKVPDGNPLRDYLLGICFMAEGQYEIALELMERTLTVNNNNFGAYTARAVLKFYMEGSIDSENELKNRWDIGSGNVLKFIEGSNFAVGGNWVDARRSWREAEGLFKGFSLYGVDSKTLSHGENPKELKHLNLGVFFYFNGLFTNALSEFESAVNYHKDSILGNYLAALICLKQGDQITALRYLENSIKKAPHFFAALYGIAELNRMNGNAEIAARYYERALDVKKEADILIKLGNIYENAGAYEKAEAQFIELIKLSPKLFIGYNQLAWLYAERSVNLEKALSLAEKADELQPDNSGILDTIGWIDFKKKEYKRALESLERAHKIYPDNPTILYHIGAVYHALGDKVSEGRYLEKALSISQDFREAEEAQRLLQR
jgi:tetratricopeptide (TPR) repeat protein